MANKQRRFIPITSVAWLILLSGITVGVAAHSLMWGAAAAVVLFTGAWCELKAVQATTAIHGTILTSALDRLEKKLDTLAGARSERQETDRP